MVSDDAARLMTALAAALQQRVSDKLTTVQAAEAHASVRTIALLLEEE
jgi:hypothetical protein